MLDGLAEEHLRGIIDAIPLKRTGTTREMAGACLFLASELSRFVTGGEVRCGLREPMVVEPCARSSTAVESPIEGCANISLPAAWPTAHVGPIAMKYSAQPECL
jgi:hypothetical protein